MFVENHKKLSRNFIKSVALIAMLFDHIALTFSASFPLWLTYTFRAIGRISFPIFSFCVANGYKHTHSKTKYVLTILVVAIISQIPYSFLFYKAGYFKFNILFSYLTSIFIMYLYDNYFVENKTIYKVLFVVLLTLCLVWLGTFEESMFSVSYGVLGILLTFLFYVFLENKTKQFVSFCILLVVQFLNFILLGGVNYAYTYINLTSVFSFVFIYFYNPNTKQTNKIHKYIFYVFFPLHLFVLALLKFFIYG